MTSRHRQNSADRRISNDLELHAQIDQIVQLAYPEPWNTKWLELPLPERYLRDCLHFKVICSDLPSVRTTVKDWPPTSLKPDTWHRWEPSQGHGFRIRAKRHDPILRDRLILLELDEFSESARSTITERAVYDACLFVSKSGRVVWHNPPKGGANAPGSAHFQSMPVLSAARDLTLPCCGLAYELNPGNCCDVRLISRNDYPVLGATIVGHIDEVAHIVWEIIFAYDKALACNLLIHPIELKEEQIRAFVFPRSRTNRCRVTADALVDGENILLQNNRGGVYSEWTFAGVEMGLLTQVEWGPVYQAMSREPEKWGESLHRILCALTLDEREGDWTDFQRSASPYITRV